MPTQVIITYGAIPADAKYISVNIPIQTLCNHYLKKCSDWNVNREEQKMLLYSQALQTVKCRPKRE